MNGKVYVGRKALSLTEYDPASPITGVILWVDSENSYEAGNETGTVIEQDCPYATQAMANALLSTLQGYSYRGLEADGAKVTPIAELGDGITVNGIYTQLAYQNIRFSSGEVMDVAAPGSNETLHEYKTEGDTTKYFQHQIAETHSLITKTSEEIMLAVENELKGLSSSITIQLDNITSQVTGLNGQVSTLQQTATSIQSQVNGLNGQVSTISQKVDNITLSVSNGTDRSYIDLSVGGIVVSSQTVRFTGDVVFESDLSSGNTTVSGDCITTGQVSADYIRLGGEMEVYESSSSRADLGGYIGYVRSYDYNGNQTYGMGLIEAVTENQVVATSGGVRMTTSNGEVVVATNITLDTGNSVNVYAGNRFTSNVDLTVTSDRNKKDKIQYDIAEKYIPLFDQLKPASFIFKEKADDHRHTGFIAQDVENALKNCGIPVEDFAALSIDDELGYGLTYGEFTAILTAKIQDMDRRLKALEVRYGGN